MLSARSQAIAAVDEHQLAVEQAQARVGALDVRAPFAGVVVTRHVDGGEVVRFKRADHDGLRPRMGIMEPQMDADKRRCLTEISTETGPPASFLNRPKVIAVGNRF